MRKLWLESANSLGMVSGIRDKEVKEIPDSKEAREVLLQSNAQKKH